MRLTMLSLEEKKNHFPVLLSNFEGDVSKVLYQLGLTRYYYNKWMREDQEFIDACSEVAESLLDMTEGALLKNIKAGKSTDIQFMLKTKGRSRGYGEKLEVNHTGGIAHAHGVMHFPPEPESLEDWEAQVSEAEQRRLTDSADSPERENSGDDIPEAEYTEVTTRPLPELVTTG